MAETERAMLVCNPTTIAPGTPASAGECSRCRRPVWIAHRQIMDVPRDAIPVCGPCCLSDPDFTATLTDEELRVMLDMWGGL